MSTINLDSLKWVSVLAASTAVETIPTIPSACSCDQIVARVRHKNMHLVGVPRWVPLLLRSLFPVAGAIPSGKRFFAIRRSPFIVLVIPKYPDVNMNAFFCLS